MSSNLFAQDSLLVDKKYKEDQFYVNLTYNSLLNKPKEIVQNGLSMGVHFGYIYDYQLRKDGKWALGMGLGYAYDKFQSNLAFSKNEEKYFIITEDFSKNKIESHSIELPIEIRYRTSSPTVYKFWRVYFGGKISYSFSSKNVYKIDGNTTKTKPLAYFEKWQFGPQISVGFNTWNIYANWNIQPMFSKKADNELLKISPITNLKVGLQFYIF